MIAKGTYRARALDAALGITSTGKEQIGILFELADESAQRIMWFGYFTEQTLDRTVESLRHLGWQGDNLADFSTGLPADCTHEVEIVIDHEADQTGELRARVRWINSGRGVAVKERLDDQAARSFGARMRARVAAIGTGRPRETSRPAPPRPASPAPGGESRGTAAPPYGDVPF